MRTRLPYRILFLVIMTLPIACHKDTDVILDQEDTPDPPGTIVTTGLVSVLDDPSLAGPQTVQAFAGNTDTYAKDAYLYNQAQMIDRDRSLLALETPGRLTFYQVTSLRENDINYTHWSVPAVTTYAGSSGQTESYSLNGVEIQIPSGSLRTTGGQPFDGIYTLHMAEITGQDAAMPTYSGLDPDEGPASLLIDRAIFIDWRSVDGDPLTASESVRMTFPGSTGLRSWFFDPERSRWIDQPGSGPLPVTRSGYYCQAVTRQQVRAEGTLQVNGHLLPHYPIEVRYGDILRTFYTTNAGHWQVLLPAETEIRFNVPMPCRAPVELTATTPASATMTMPISLEVPEVRNVAWSGTIRNCQAAPISGGFLVPEEDVRKVVYQPAADLQFRTLACPGDTIRIQAVDVVSYAGGPTIPWPVKDTIDMGSVFACTEAGEEYLYLSVSGEEKMYWDLRSAMTNEMRLLIEDPNAADGSDFRLLVSGMEPREYADTELNIVFEDMGLGQKGYSLYCPTSTDGCGFTRFTMTHFPAASGQWIRGRFEGRFWIKSFNPLTAGYRPVACEFQVYRDF